jgi:hypothetical protein
MKYDYITPSSFESLLKGVRFQTNRLKKPPATHFIVEEGFNKFPEKHFSVNGDVSFLDIQYLTLFVHQRRTRYSLEKKKYIEEEQMIETKCFRLPAPSSIPKGIIMPLDYQEIQGVRINNCALLSAMI